MARNGVVATSQPLASAAGLRVLQQGGNAIDAAVTAAAVLSVVEPTMNGVGGDLFAIVYDAKTRTVRGLNASGRAPQPPPRPKSTAAASSTRFPIAASSRSAFPAWSTAGRSCWRNTERFRSRERSSRRSATRAMASPVSDIISEQWKAESQDTRAGSRCRGDVPAGRARTISGRRLQEPAASRRRSTRSRAAGAMRSTAGRSRRRSPPT